MSGSCVDDDCYISLRVVCGSVVCDALRARACSPYHLYVPVDDSWIIITDTEEIMRSGRLVNLVGA